MIDVSSLITAALFTKPVTKDPGPDPIPRWFYRTAMVILVLMTIVLCLLIVYGLYLLVECFM